MSIVQSVHLIPNTQKSCTYLASSSPCGDQFAGFPTVFSERTLISFFDSLTKPDRLNEIFTAAPYNCESSYAMQIVDMIRYEVTFYCSRLVFDGAAAGCPTPAPVPAICPEQCQAATNSYASISTNTNFCAYDRSIVSEKIHSTHQAFCSSLSPSASCIPAAGVESEFGGFRSQSGLDNYCKQNPGDVLCPKSESTVINTSQNAPDAKSQASQDFATSTLKISTSAASDVTSNSQGSSVNNGGSAGIPNTYIFIGSGILFLLVITLCCISYRRRDSYRNSTVKNIFSKQSTYISKGVAQSRQLSYPIATRELLPNRKTTDTTNSLIAGYFDDGYKFVVIKSFEAIASDEISVCKGDYIKVIETFSDGWCLAVDMDGNGGALPQCILRKKKSV